MDRILARPKVTASPRLWENRGTGRDGARQRSRALSPYSEFLMDDLINSSLSRETKAGPLIMYGG